MEPGLPVLRSAQLKESLKLFAAFRNNHPVESTEAGAEPNKQPPAPELVRVDTPPSEPVPLTGPITPVPVATPISIARATPAPKQAKIASAKASPTPSLRGTASPTPNLRLTMLATPRPRPTATPFPVATPIPVAPMIASDQTPKPSGVQLVPFIQAKRDPSLSNSGSSWRTYAPGQAPPGRVVGLDDVAALADRGEIGERLYLRGDFRVTASSPSRAVLRDANKPDDQSPRVLVEYPSGAVAPQERDRLSRDSSRPYQIYNVRRGPDGVVTIWVKEITRQ
jgi:hypothetical protein